MLTIEEAQSMTLTRLHVDNTSVVVAVLSGERLAYGGGRNGFGGASWWLVDRGRLLHRRRIAL